MSELQHHFATVSGGKLHYVSAGSGRLMLFVHGFPEFWYAWRAQLEHFGADHHAVALDMRGYNLSFKPAEAAAYRAKYLVQDLAELIRHHTSDKAIVVAHDWGGAAAWNLAAQHPQLIERLVILNSPHPITFARELKHNPAQHAASQYMNLLRSDKAERVMAEDNYRRLFNMTLAGWHGVRYSEQDRQAYLQAWSQPGALTGGLNYYRASPLYPREPGDAAPELDPAQFMVRVPTLVIWGERDPALLTGILDGLENYVSDLKVVRVPDATHWIAHEKPELVNRLIREFVS